MHDNGSTSAGVTTGDVAEVRSDKSVDDSGSRVEKAESRREFAAPVIFLDGENGDSLDSDSDGDGNSSDNSRDVVNTKFKIKAKGKKRKSSVSTGSDEEEVEVKKKKTPKTPKKKKSGSF